MCESRGGAPIQYHAAYPSLALLLCVGPRPLLPSALPLPQPVRHISDVALRGSDGPGGAPHGRLGLGLLLDLDRCRLPGPALRVECLVLLPAVGRGAVRVAAVVLLEIVPAQPGGQARAHRGARAFSGRTFYIAYTAIGRLTSDEDSWSRSMVSD